VLFVSLQLLHCAKGLHIIRSCVYTTDKLLCYNSTNDVGYSSVQDPPIVTLLENETMVDGYFGRVWKIMEQNMNFR